MLPGIKLFDLTGRTAVITGGSKGLGKAMAAALASAGANVLLVSRTLSEAQSAANEIAADHGHHAKALAADITDETQANSIATTALDLFGRLDILINSAGINIRGPIDELSPAQFKQVIDTNVTGTWLACRAVTPHMKSAGTGRIINLSSALGLVGVPNRTPYASSKGAVSLMTKSLALELAPHNIMVNAICPGPFLTEMNQPIADTEDGKKFIVGATALERWARLEEIQGAALYLASDAASYTTGSMLSVDGGWTAR
ncbi:MAG: SDR family NAD(P)-dependent oxidoreductase [Verrucomicrobiales bacterium]|nr:SDR family NAD(P)-dependent oxidoreductase [Verrucomicrobiales bacterium]